MTVQSDPHVLAIGETLVDVVITHEQPDFPAKVLGGSSANVVLTSGRSDRPMVLATWIGLDERGCLVDFHMHDSGVHVTRASCGASHTSTALARLNGSGVASYTFDLEWAPAPPITVPPTARIIEAGSTSAIIEPSASAVFDALTRGREHMLVCLNPNARPSAMDEPAAALASSKRSIALADVIKISDGDVEWLTSGMPIDEVVDRWLGIGASLAVVAHGKYGSLAVTSSGVCFTGIPSDVEAVDTVGIGDSFVNGMIDAMWGMGLRDADVRTIPCALPEEQVHVIIDHVSAVSDVTVSRKDANSPWAHELS